LLAITWNDGNALLFAQITAVVGTALKAELLAVPGIIVQANAVYRCFDQSRNVDVTAGVRAVNYPPCGFPGNVEPVTFLSSA
jgi:hypothetical protein